MIFGEFNECILEILPAYEITKNSGNSTLILNNQKSSLFWQKSGQFLPGFGGSGRGPLKNGEFGSSSSFSFGGTGFDSSTFGLVKNKNNPKSVKTRDHRTLLSYIEDRNIWSRPYFGGIR